ncbi:MAG: gamma carbonic anhydrase family protein [Vulcanimicrobiaceae bacterium]
MDEAQFAELLSKVTTFAPNPFHPLVWIVGEPVIGEGVYIGGFSEVNAKGARVEIGNYCDIASFVSINAADSHRKTIGLAQEVDRKNITIGEHVFIGSHCVIKGGANIGHHSVVAAGTIVEAQTIPPYSLVAGNPMTVKRGYYAGQAKPSLDHPGSPH